MCARCALGSQNSHAEKFLCAAAREFCTLSAHYAHTEFFCEKTEICYKYRYNNIFIKYNSQNSHTSSLSPKFGRFWTFILGFKGTSGILGIINFSVANGKVFSGYTRKIRASVNGKHADRVIRKFAEGSNNRRGDERLSNA